MRQHPLIAYFTSLAVLSGGFIAAMRLLGKEGQHLAAFYMLGPALAAILVRLVFYERGFQDAGLRAGRLRHWFAFYGLSLGVTALSFLFFTALGSIRWDPSASTFLNALEKQMKLTGGNIRDLPAGLTPAAMLWLFVIGGLTVLNLVPGLITGLGEELGWRGLVFPLLYRTRPSLAFVGGGLVWFTWHIPITLVFPGQNKFTPVEQILNTLILALGAIFTFTYLAYAYVKSGSILVAAFAHIVMNNAARCFGYFAQVTNQTLANLGLTVAAGTLVLLLYLCGELRVFRLPTPASNCERN